MKVNLLGSILALPLHLAMAVDRTSPRVLRQETPARGSAPA